MSDKTLIKDGTEYGDWIGNIANEFSYNKITLDQLPELRKDILTALRLAKCDLPALYESAEGLLSAIEEVESENVLDAKVAKEMSSLSSRAHRLLKEFEEVLGRDKPAFSAHQGW